MLPSVDKKELPQSQWQFVIAFPNITRSHLFEHGYTCIETLVSEQQPGNLTTFLWLICERMTTSLINSSRFSSSMTLEFLTAIILPSVNIPF